MSRVLSLARDVHEKKRKIDIKSMGFTPQEEYLFFTATQQLSFNDMYVLHFKDSFCYENINY